MTPPTDRQRGRSGQGDVSKKDNLRVAMKQAKSPRCAGRSSTTTPLPIQNFYLQEAVAAADGSYALKTTGDSADGQSGSLPRQVAR